MANEDISGSKKKIIELRRYGKILDALAEYGFDSIIEDLGLQKFVSKRHRKEISERRAPERLRLMFEDLGPTFIKLGQLLSTRPDLVAREYIVEFEKLRIEVKPFPYEDVRRIIFEELGEPVESLYQEFDAEPFAAASIGQVHRAVLPTGELVAVKVQRPDIKASVSADIEILHSLAGLFLKRTPIGRTHDPQEVVEEFGDMIRREMDYTIEGRNIDRFYQNFIDEPSVRIPKVYWSHTRERVLTMDFLEGIELQYEDKIKARGYDQRKIMAIGARALMKMLFIDGFFHADPHPANILVIDEETIGLLDFGAVGRLDLCDRERISAFYIFLFERDVERAAEVLQYIGKPTGPVDRAKLKWDLDDLSMIYRTPFMRLGYVMNANLALVTSRNQIRLPRHFVLMERAMFELEGIGIQIDPDYNVLEIARPYLEALIEARRSPSRIAGDLLEELIAYQDLLQELPAQIGEILTEIRQGELQIDLQHRNLDELVFELERSSTRLSTSLLVSAILVASAIFILAGIRLELPLIGLIGILVAGITGAWLVYSIIRGYV